MRSYCLRHTGLAVLVVLTGVALASAATAQAAVNRAARQAVSAQLIEALRSAHRLLAEANHDYQGHRAAAAAHVHKALEELGAAEAGTAVKRAARPAHHLAAHEAQAASDAQLRQAQQILQNAMSQLNGGHPKVADHAKSAIAQINTALAVR